jgi:ABC-type glycerol-3-phosphate transport system substrate-binding protein
MTTRRRLLAMTLALARALALLAVIMPMPAAAQKVVNIWHTEPNPTTKAVMDEIIKDFEKANPGIKVVQEAIGWGDLDKKMQHSPRARFPRPPTAKHTSSAHWPPRAYCGHWTT